MLTQMNVRIASVIAVLLVGHSITVAQTVTGDALRGQGSYLNGLGWYNLNTAKANSISVDATIRWKQDLRQIQLDRWDLVANQNAKKAAGKMLKIEEIKYQQLVRLRQLRIEPTAADVEAGDALNVLLYDLTDPDISQESWSNTSQQVKLPEGMSVKDLVFRFTSLKGSSATSAALSKGVIALSRLAVAGDKWPTPLQGQEIEKERAAYEAAYAKVRDQILAGQFDSKAVQAMDRSLDALNEKVKTAVSAERGYRTEAAKYVSDLKDSTRMFDATTVDYAREILNDTKDHDATTVAELVAFMLKYRLQFASAERSPGAREIYKPLFDAMQAQHKAFGITVPEVKPLAPQIPEFTKTKSGLKYRELTKGEGATPTANDTVVCHYRGWLDNGKEFDNSYDRNQTAELRMKEIIIGWAEGLQLMKVGGKIELEIPARLGYGERGAGAGPPHLNLSDELLQCLVIRQGPVWKWAVG